MNQRLETAYDHAANLVPGLGDVDRAIATARRRRIRRTIAAPAAAAALVAAATVVTVAAPWFDQDNRPATGPQDTDDCPVGEERRVFPVSPRSVVLGCAQLPDGRRLVLLDGFRGGGLCLQIVGLDNRARQCGNAPSSIEPPITRTIYFQSHAQRNESAPIEVYGVASAEVTTVDLTYTRDGSSHSTRAAYIRVTDSDVLEQAGIAEPFGYFLSELPADTSHVTATALGPAGQRLGSDGLAPYPWSKRSRSMITGLVEWHGKT